ncbi:MAG: DNA polymerase III subunit delta' [Candidatus Omnitrophota bacterium]
MSFKDVIGQESATAFLKAAFSSGRIAHAYVFVGPEGIGKRKTALNFAKLLLCESPLAHEPCESCVSCLKAGGSNHPDIQEVLTEGQFIKIDAIREACRRLSLRGFESSFKILIITQAGALNDESSNALLKTLEEPTANTVIILIADTLRSVLPTIASRCQRVVFSSLKQEVIESILMKQWGASPEAATYLSLMSDGSLGSALKFHEDGLFSRKNDLIKNALDRNCGLDGLLDLSSKERQDRQENIQEALFVLSSWFRDLLLAKTGSRSLINVDKKDDIMRDARSFSFAGLEERLDSIADAARDLKRNANARIALTKLRVELWK